MMYSRQWLVGADTVAHCYLLRARSNRRKCCRGSLFDSLLALFHLGSDFSGSLVPLLYSIFLSISISMQFLLIMSK